MCSAGLESDTAGKSTPNQPPNTTATQKPASAFISVRVGRRSRELL